MTSESGDRRSIKSPHAAGVPPPEPEHLPCPRCDSTNTKFCYYNNYNFSQPRHFCKSCRRYWTKGGTLRDIPVGGGTRKPAKRCRTTSAAPTPVHCSSPPQAFNLSGDVYGGAPPCGSFTSLLGAYGPGFNGLGGFVGLGVGPGFEDMGFGLRRPAWPFVDGGAMGANTWQLQSGENGYMSGGAGGECFTLPELAISTPGSYLK